MTSLLRTEVSKQFRRPRTYVALGLMVAIPVIVTFALHTTLRSAQGSERTGSSTSRSSAVW